MTNGNRKVYDTLLLLLAQSISFIISFLTNPLLARSLTYEENGTLGQIYIITNISSIVFGLGLSAITNYMLNRKPDDARKTFRIFFWITLLSCLVGIGLLLLSLLIVQHSIGANQLVDNMVWYAPVIYTQITITCLSAFLIFANKARAFSFITVVMNALKLGLMYFSIHYLHSLKWMLVSVSLTTILNLVIAAMMLPRSMISFKWPQLSRIVKTIKLGVPYMAISLVSIGIIYIDGILISFLLGTKQYAIYRNGALEVPFLGTIYLSISSMLTPQLYKRYYANDIEGIFRLKKQAATLVAFAIYPAVIFLSINSGSFISLYLSSKYASSAILFSIYSLGTLIRITDYEDLLVVKNRPRKILLTTIITFAVNIVLNLIFIHLWGVKGSTIAYVLSLGVYFFTIVYFTTQAFQIRMLQFFDYRSLLKILTVSTVLSLSVRFFVPVHGIIQFILIGCVYALIAYFTLIRILKFAQLDFLPPPVIKVLKVLRLQ